MRVPIWAYRCFALKIDVTFDCFNLLGKIPVFNIWLISSVKGFANRFFAALRCLFDSLSIPLLSLFLRRQLMKQHNLHLCLSNLKYRYMI